MFKVIQRISDRSKQTAEASALWHNCKTSLISNKTSSISRFDCGSGIGVVRSEETILLNQWNHISLYRHRWDAWIQLNGGKHVEGRSKGLFSRITFREPLFIGGAGNTTGLLEKLPVSAGFKGCIRHLEVNDHVYRFALDPMGEAFKGYGIGELIIIYVL